LGFDGVALVLDLGGQLSANELFLLRRNLLRKLKRLEPVLQIHSHLQRQFLLRALHETFLSQVVLEKDGGDVAH